jgi:hypothetical protein
MDLKVVIVLEDFHQVSKIGLQKQVYRMMSLQQFLGQGTIRFGISSTSHGNHTHSHSISLFFSITCRVGSTTSSWIVVGEWLSQSLASGGKGEFVDIKKTLPSWDDPSVGFVQVRQYFIHTVRKYHKIFLNDNQNQIIGPFGFAERLLKELPVS